MGRSRRASAARRARPRRRRRVPDGDRLGRRRRRARPRRTDRREPPQPHADALHRGLAARRRARRGVGPRPVARARRRGPALGIADSSYNEHDLIESGSRRTTVVPILLDLATLDVEPAPDAGAHRARSPGCSSGGSRRTRRNTTSSKRSPRTASSTTPTRACTSSAAAAKTATRARSQRFIHALGLDDAVTLTGGVSPGRARRRTTAPPTCSSCAASTKASAFRCSKPCTTGVPDRRVRVDRGPRDARRRPDSCSTSRTRARSRRPSTTSSATPALREQLVERRRAPRARLRSDAHRSRVRRGVIDRRAATHREARRRHAALRRRDPRRRRDRGPAARDPPRARDRASRSKPSPRARSTPPPGPITTRAGIDRDRRRAGAPLSGDGSRGRPTSTPRTDLVVRRGRRVAETEQREWIEKQGPVAPGLIEAIAQSDADVFAFHPFLYHPTVVGPAPASPTRSILHPRRARRTRAAAPALPRCVRRRGRARVLERARTPTRRATVPRSRRNPRSWSASASTPAPGDPTRPAARSVSTTARTCCVSAASTTAKARACSRNASPATRTGAAAPLRLVFAGPVAQRAARPSRHRCHRRGRRVREVGPPARRARVRVAERVRVVLDRARWKRGRSALPRSSTAGARSRSTTCNVPGGGFAFGDYAELEVELDRLTASPALRTALGQRRAGATSTATTAGTT